MLHPISLLVLWVEMFSNFFCLFRAIHCILELKFASSDFITSNLLAIQNAQAR